MVITFYEESTHPWRFQLGCKIKELSIKFTANPFSLYVPTKD